MTLTQFYSLTLVTIFLSDIHLGATSEIARDPLSQPFASWSIWNLPIGKGASLVPASLNQTSTTTIEADPDVILLDPSHPTTDFIFSSAAWTGKSRCQSNDTRILLRAPYPPDYIIPSDGNNYGGAILMTDKRTIKQTQPLCHCQKNSQVTTFANSPDVDLYGDGIAGAHGGSGLSAIGGTIRLGEFIPDNQGHVQPVRHALKTNLWAAKNYFRVGHDKSSCFRWPAKTCDGYFDDRKPDQYGGGNPAVRPGSLLTLDHSIDITKIGLMTTPAISLAWTIQNYGLYIVDDSYWDAFAIETEVGPQGDYQKQFRSAWNFDFRSNSNNWAKDVKLLFSKLSVVDNWSYDLYQSVVKSNGALGSGGGQPYQPWISPIS